MADFNSLLAQYAGEQDHLNKIARIAATKQQQVANTAAKKQEQLSPTQVRKSAVASVFDVPVTGTQIEQDVDTMSGADLFMKYGDAIIDPLVQRERQRTQIQGTLAAEDSVPQVAGNSVLSLGQGLANTVGSVGALGLGVLNDDAGIAASQLLQQYNENANSLKSDNLRESMRLNQEVNAITEQTSAVRHAKDVKEKGALVAGLSRIGREALNSGSALLSDPRMLGDVTAQGVGSLLAVGPLGKGIAAGGNTGLAGKSISNFLAKNSTAAGIGLVGGGGAYTSTVNDWMSKTYPQLAAESPEYVELAKRYGSEKAKRIIADNAGKVAAAIAGPTSMVLGKLVDKFEVDPTKALGFKGTLSALGRETIEEGLGGSASQIASNIAGNVIGGTDKSLTEGVGRQLGEGAVAGLFTTGAVRAPSVLAGGIVETAKLGGGIVNAGKGVLAKRNKTLEEDSRFTPEAAQETVNTVNANATAAVNELTTAAQSLPAEEQKAVIDKVEQIKSATALTDDDLSMFGDGVRSQIAGKDTYNAINKLLEMVESPEKFSTEQDDAQSIEEESIYAILDIYNKVNSFLGSNEDILNDPATSDQIKSYIANVQDSLDMLYGDKNIRAKVGGVIDNYLATGAPSPLEASKIGTPEGDRAARNLLAAIQVAPDKVSPEVIQTVLQHATARKWKLSGPMKQALQLARNLAISLGSVNRDTITGDKIERVGNQITKNVKIISPLGKSTDQHVREIVSAKVKQDISAMTTAIESFGMFAQHLQNKLEAVEKSKAGTNANVEFEQLVRSPAGDTWAVGKANYNPNGKGPDFYNRLAQEANVVGNLYNTLVKAYKLGEPIKLANKVATDVTVKAEPKKNKPKLTSAQKTETEKEIARLDKEMVALEKIIKSFDKDINKSKKQGSLYTALKNTLSAKQVKELFGDNKPRNFYAKKASEVNSTTANKEVVEIIQSMLENGQLREYVIEDADSIAEFIDVDWGSHAETIVSRFQEDSPYKYLRQSARNTITISTDAKNATQAQIDALSTERLKYEDQRAAEELAKQASEQPRSDDQSSTQPTSSSKAGSDPKPATGPSGQSPEPTGSTPAKPTRVSTLTSIANAVTSLFRDTKIANSVKAFKTLAEAMKDADIESFSGIPLSKKTDRLKLTGINKAFIERIENDLLPGQFDTLVKLANNPIELNKAIEQLAIEHIGQQLSSLEEITKKELNLAVKAIERELNIYANGGMVDTEIEDKASFFYEFKETASAEFIREKRGFKKLYLDKAFNAWAYSSIVPALKKDITLNTDFNKEILVSMQEDFRNGVITSNFLVAYKEKLKSLNNSRPFTSVNGGKWFKYNQGTSDVTALTGISLSTWCTSKGMANYYLSKGDFYVFTNEDGTTKYAIQFDGDNVGQIQNVKNNGSVSKNEVQFFQSLIDAKNSPLNSKQKFSLASQLKINSSNNIVENNGLPKLRLEILESFTKGEYVNKNTALEFLKLSGHDAFATESGITIVGDFIVDDYPRFYNYLPIDNVSSNRVFLNKGSHLSYIPLNLLSNPSIIFSALDGPIDTEDVNRHIRDSKQYTKKRVINASNGKYSTEGEPNKLVYVGHRPVADLSNDKLITVRIQNRNGFPQGYYPGLSLSGVPEEDDGFPDDEYIDFRPQHDEFIDFHPQHPDDINEPFLGFDDPFFDNDDDEIPFSKNKENKNIQGFVYNNIAYLISDNIPAGDERSVIMHEVGSHLGIDTVLDKNKQLKLVGVIKNNWSDRKKSTLEYKVYKAATARVKLANSTGNMADRELIAYAVEEATKLGVTPSQEKAEGTIAKWLYDVLNAFKLAIDKLTGFENKLNTQDLIDIAYGAALYPATMSVASSEPVENNTGTDIYSKLGNKTVLGNVVIKPVYQKEGVAYAKENNGVFSLRVDGTTKHFGNPFSSDTRLVKRDNLIQTESIKDSVIKYIDWVLTSTDDRAEWIRSVLKNGKLKDKSIIYYKELNEPSHATALDYLINKYNWDTGTDTTQSTVSTLVPKNALVIGPVKNVDKKALVKAKYANKFIGFGLSDSISSTESYRKAAGDLANTGSYTNTDVVFVSIPGKREYKNEKQAAQDKTIKEALKAISSGATLLTDNEAYVNSSTYNEGEKKLRTALLEANHKYSEFTDGDTTIGVWNKANTDTDVEPTTETPIVDENTTEGYYDDNTTIKYNGTAVNIRDKLLALDRVLSELTNLTNCTL